MSLASGVTALAQRVATEFKSVYTALGLKADKANPTFTGTVIAAAIRVTTGATNGRVLVGDASGNATWQQWKPVYRDTAANWTSANTLLALSAIAQETDTGKVKIGDGVTTWNTLPYTKVDIGDVAGSTTVGQALMGAADQAAGRSAIAAIQKPATQVSGSGMPWASECVLNSGALASGYNDIPGGVITDKQIILRQISVRIGLITGAVTGGTVQFDIYQGTTTTIGTLISSPTLAAAAHDTVATLGSPATCPINTVLRVNVILGSGAVADEVHVQFRGDVDVN